MNNRVNCRFVPSCQRRNAVCEGRGRSERRARGAALKRQSDVIYSHPLAIIGHLITLLAAHISFSRRDPWLELAPSHAPFHALQPPSTVDPAGHGGIPADRSLHVADQELQVGAVKHNACRHNLCRECCCIPVPARRLAAREHGQGTF